MKTKDTWQFSAPLAEVNVRRILREARVVDGNVVRFTIDGKVYTAWSERHGFPYISPRGQTSTDRPVYWNQDGNLVKRNYLGQVLVTDASNDDDGGFWQIRIQRGDHVKALYDRVEVQVETFAAPKV